MSENGPIPDPDRIVSEKANWLFFVTWSGTILTQKTSKDQLRNVYQHSRVLTLDELPDWKRHPFSSAGKPMKLVFPAAPGGVAVGGIRRRPVTVSVQDNEGHTIRDKTFSVVIALATNSTAGELKGTLTQRTINGVATFPDLRLGNPGGGFVLAANADGLEGASSIPFSVGPGGGLLHEWWTGRDGNRLADLSATATHPMDHEILGRAAEVPFREATNYGARFRGWVLPPSSGSYVFWIANDGYSELWLSTDSTTTNKVKIAAITKGTPYVKWPHTHETESAAVELEAGKRYFIEVLHQQPSGSVHLSLRWRLPDRLEQRPIPADRLIPFATESSRLAQKDLAR
jgi:hypothetical protein